MSNSGLLSTLAMCAAAHSREHRCSAHADEDSDYRLAGIVAVGPERLLAVIEMPDGRQGLFRSGDALAGGRITDITRTEVHIAVGADQLVLSLRGNPKLSGCRGESGRRRHAL